MDLRLKRYYLKKMYGGRSLVARALDFVAFRALLMIVLLVSLWQLSRSLTTALLVSIFLTLALSLMMTRMRTRRIERYIENDMKKIKERCLLEALTFMEPGEYAAYIGRLMGGLDRTTPTDTGFCAEKEGALVYAFHNHPSAACDAADVLGVLRGGKGRRIVLVSLSAFTQAAKTLCADQEIKLIGGEDVLSLAAQANMLPDEQTARQKAEKEMNEAAITLGRLKESALSRGKFKGYMVCGVAAIVWPFVTGFRFYYPIIAAVCFVLAVVTYRKNRSAGDTPDISIS